MFGNYNTPHKTPPTSRRTAAKGGGATGGGARLSVNRSSCQTSVLPAQGRQGRQRKDRQCANNERNGHGLPCAVDALVRGFFRPVSELTLKLFNLPLLLAKYHTKHGVGMGLSGARHDYQEDSCGKSGTQRILPASPASLHRCHADEESQRNGPDHEIIHAFILPSNSRAPLPGPAVMIFHSEPARPPAPVDALVRLLLLATGAVLSGMAP